MGFGQRYHVDRHGQLAIKQLRLSVLNEMHTNSYTGPRLFGLLDLFDVLDMLVLFGVLGLLVLFGLLDLFDVLGLLVLFDVLGLLVLFGLLLDLFSLLTCLTCWFCSHCGSYSKQKSILKPV